MACYSWTGLCLIPFFISVQNAASFFKVLSTFFLLASFWFSCLTPIFRRNFTPISSAKLLKLLNQKFLMRSDKWKFFYLLTSLCTTRSLVFRAFLVEAVLFSAPAELQEEDEKETSHSYPCYTESSLELSIHSDGRMTHTAPWWTGRGHILTVDEGK